jgi:hypothetical protein
MKKTIAILILLSFGTPVQAGMIRKYDPVEQELIQKQQLEQDMSREFKKQAEEPAKPITSAKTEEPVQKSNWWKWALGAVIVGGIAAAASGGGGGGSSSGGSSGGTLVGTW